MSEHAGSSGVPIEASRKGKTPPLERGRGKVFPFLSSPIGSLREALVSEEIMGPTIVLWLGQWPWSKIWQTIPELRKFTKSVGRASELVKMLEKGMVGKLVAFW